MYSNYKSLETILLEADPQHFYINLFSAKLGGDFEEDPLAPLDIIAQFIESFHDAIEKGNPHLILEVLQSFFVHLSYKNPLGQDCICLLSEESCSYLEDSPIMPFIITCLQNYTIIEIHIKALQLLDYLICQSRDIFVNMFFASGNDGILQILQFINPQRNKEIVSRSIQIVYILSQYEQSYPLITDPGFVEHFLNFCLGFIRITPDDLAVIISYYTASLLKSIIETLFKESPNLLFSPKIKNQIYAILSYFYFPRNEIKFPLFHDIFPHLQKIAIGCFEIMSIDYDFITKIFPNVISMTSKLPEKNIISMYRFISNVFEDKFYREEKEMLAMRDSSDNQPGLPWLAFKDSLMHSQSEVIAVLNVLDVLVRFDPDIMIIMVGFDIHNILKLILNEAPFDLKEGAMKVVHTCLTCRYKDQDRMPFADREMTELIISLLDCESENLDIFIIEALQQVRLLNISNEEIQAIIEPILEEATQQNE